MSTFINADERFNALPPDRQARIMAKAQAMQASIRLAELRKEQNTTQQQLAQKLNVSQSNIAQMEGRGDIQLSSCYNICMGLGLNWIYRRSCRTEHECNYWRIKEQARASVAQLV